MLSRPDPVFHGLMKPAVINGPLCLGGALASREVSSQNVTQFLHVWEKTIPVHLQPK